MWTSLRRMMKDLDPVRVENPAWPGTPDVNYGGEDPELGELEGWIELKWARRWPTNAQTVLQLPHFTPQQRAWLLRRHTRGGRVHLLLKVGPSWLLFRGDVAARVVGRANRAELSAAACGFWPKGLRETEFRKCLLTTK